VVKQARTRVTELMCIFVINAENQITAYRRYRTGYLPKGVYAFANAKELATLASTWPGTRLVEIWNKLPNVNAVRKFTDRMTAARRIWRAVQNLLPTEQSQTIVPRRGKTPTETGPRRGHNGTKTERIIALLKQPSGATLKEIMAETGWKPHSVRGFISGQLSRRLGFRIKSFKRAGERVYRIVSNRSTGIKGGRREHITF
jgi:transglutaminase/protease-like cytokinesis protein 3